MPRCRLCQTTFPNWVKIEGKVRNISRRQYCLLCSPFGKHNTRVISRHEELGKCSTCGKGLTARKDGKRRSYSLTKCHYCYLKERRQARKAQAVEYKGGKCLKCGYGKAITSLVFHHLTPDKKEFSISSRPGYGWKRTKKELDKCVLLCTNCHGEQHEGLLTTKELSELETVRIAQR